MDFRKITDDYAVAPQIDAGDVAALKAAGIVAIIDNRPDSEVEPEQQGEAIGAAARDAGLDFHLNPVAGGQMSEENVRRQREIVDTAAGPVLAYCRSGTRSTHVWALGQAGERPVDEIVRLAGAAGYDLEPLRPTLDSLARR